MTALLLPFATRLSDGRLVSPDEVERGMACNCACPGCKVAVLAKQGTEREWHFAHAKGEKCAEGYEVSIHELAKQMLRQRKELLLPSLIAKTSGVDAYGRFLEEREPVLESSLVKLDECKTGVNLGGVNVDAIGRLKGHEILIEVTVFHRLMPASKNGWSKQRFLPFRSTWSNSNPGRQPENYWKRRYSRMKISGDGSTIQSMISL